MSFLPNRIIVLLACLSCTSSVWAQDEKKPSYPSFDYDAAQAHEIKPHRGTIPLKGVNEGFNQLHLTLTVSATGDVIDAEAAGDEPSMKFWPQLQDEVREWKFMPFELNGKAVTAEIEEYIDLVPPERLPQKHVAAPTIKPSSKVTIALERTGCFGSCPSYTVTISTDGISFDGRGYVVAAGKHTAAVNPDEVRFFAKKFVAADFYSMDSTYRAAVTDNPFYLLSIAIDGHKKEVEDYVGSWVGMPAMITQLENDVDEFAQTQRWIAGSEGLVDALHEEKANFRTFEAQVMLKEVAIRGMTTTLQELLDSGVPLDPMRRPKSAEPYAAVPFENEGWLTVASGHPDELQILIEAEASKEDQNDKNLALAGAARAGNVEGARALIDYGANPNVDLKPLTVTERSVGMIIGGEGAGSILIYAAESGNPDMIREILHYQPNLEARDREGKTAMFAASEYRYSDKDGARVECVRLLAQAGANVNARDNDGNTPLHETFLTDVEEELLKLGADVNARNDDGETPIFTTVDNDAFALFIGHGADLTIRNSKGQTVLQAAAERGPATEEALQKAIQSANQR